MTVIGIDTSCRVGGIAVVRAGRLLGGELFGLEAGHSERLLPALERLLEELELQPDQIDGIAVSFGPGSFTGLRIGLAAAKGLAYAWQLPLVGVSTLKASAWTFKGVDAMICASLDARRESVYRAWYDGRTLEAAGSGPVPPEERVGVDVVAQEAEEARTAGRQVILVGDGAPAVMSAIEARRGRGEAAAAVAMAPFGAEVQRPANVACIGAEELKLGRRDDPFSIVPNYLRRSEAERRWLQRQS